MGEKRTTPFLWVNKTSKSRFLSRSDRAEAQHINQFVQQQRFIRECQKSLELRLSNKVNWGVPQSSSATHEEEIHSGYGSGSEQEFASPEFTIIGTR